MKSEAMVRKAWMDYFNRTLRERGHISEQEYRKLKNKIAAKYSSTSLAQNSQRGANFLLKAEQVNKV